MITFCEITLLHISLFLVHPKVSFKIKNLKAASIRNNSMTVKVKIKMLYVEVET